jgi:hypothetical protein
MFNKFSRPISRHFLFNNANDIDTIKFNVAQNYNLTQNIYF